MMKKQIADFGVHQALRMLHSDPDKAIEKILGAFDLISRGAMPSQRRAPHERLGTPDTNYRQLTANLLERVDKGVLDKIIENFALNASLVGWQRQEAARKEYGCNVPWAILLDPTSACNLHCVGCWVADYGNKLNLSFDDIDRIICQGKELGVYMYIYTGGEPLVRKKDIIALCEKHDDCIFLCFTNATLIDQEFCDNLLRVKNFIPAISLEGNRETTDARRGTGTYDKIIAGMGLLQQNKLPFGISCCYTRDNFEAVSDDSYIDWLIELGAFFIWYFHYMPVGSDANEQLLCTPEQRVVMYHTIRRWRETKPIFPMDFQNDGQYVQGCIAGGRRYLHINANGDADPCVFVHFSDSNIHEKTLLECLQAPLFMAYHDGQPFNENHLRPCPMLENPSELRHIIEKTGAKSSNLEGDETAERLCSRCDKYAAEWRPVADRLWALNHRCSDFSR